MVKLLRKACFANYSRMQGCWNLYHHHLPIKHKVPDKYNEERFTIIMHLVKSMFAQLNQKTATSIVFNNTPLVVPFILSSCHIISESALNFHKQV
jgi:hypothetical protein